MALVRDGREFLGLSKSDSLYFIDIHVYEKEFAEAESSTLLGPRCMLRLFVVFLSLPVTYTHAALLERWDCILLVSSG